MKGLFIWGLQGIFNKLIIMLIFLIYPSLNFSQVYQIDNDEVTTRVILDNEYLVLSKFESKSGNFISTLGGYYKPGEFLNLNDHVYDVNLEFNSNYDQDSIKSLSIVKTSKWTNISKSNDILKGKWVMSGRYNNGEFRSRKTDLPRKNNENINRRIFSMDSFQYRNI
jgi:thioredoxin-related protein